MNIRAKILNELQKELLGPRDGINELNKNPDFEYLTGVLVPKDLFLDPIEEISDLDPSKKNILDTKDIYSIVSDFGDNDPDSFDLETSFFDSAIDPRSRPKSLGISFILESNHIPTIDFCVTYARYREIEYKKWQRFPEFFYQFKINVTEDWNSKSINKSDVPVYLIQSRIASNLWKVSLYLVNEIPLKDIKKYSFNDLIFQPQIRVVCGPDTKLSYLKEFESEDPDDARFTHMYRHRRTFARGHMCSAIWKELEFSSSSNDEENIFEWIDSKILPENVAVRFRTADVRSEYLPCYSVQQPPAVRSLSATELAETFDPDELGKKLESLVSGYKNWIEEKEIQSKFENISKTHLDECKKSLGRMISAINLICNDEKVRLAFCFMNAAMDMQFKWESQKKGKENGILIWYRFQLAFILQCLEGIVNPLHSDREICDLLWYPTGGGKTEAYLALMSFTLAYRRLSYKKDNYNADGGVSVISRYTLRLLTIQQFRRSVKAILACDKLRVTNWKPTGFNFSKENLWGKTRFSIGLWVGQEVTPNKLEDSTTPDEIFLGAIGSLLPKESYVNKSRRIKDNSEPAQILNCPCCDTILAIPSNPDQEYTKPQHDTHIITWIFTTKSLKRDFKRLSVQGFTVNENNIIIEPLPHDDYYSITIPFSYKSGTLTSDKIDKWWKYYVSLALGTDQAELCSARASRPGYFLKYAHDSIPYDFEIRCPNLKCPLNSVEWFEEIPNSTKTYSKILPAFQTNKNQNHSFGMPISAYTVDTQIYRYCPSFLISTVDKFARLPFEAYSAAIFGNVDSYDSFLGYFRNEIGPDSNTDQLGYIINIKPFLPPSLIIQDELHLIDGPLGTMTGLYETAVDMLATTENGIKPKYIVSTATIKDAENQVKSLFNRKFALFPSPGITIDDSYFSSFTESNTDMEDEPGRLYVGVCTPGKTLLPIVRVWSVLLKEVKLLLDQKTFDIEDIDSFWTLVGYFNSLKELAVARAIYSGTEIVGRIGNDANGNAIRDLNYQNLLELSGQSSSLNLPTILRRIEKENAFDVDSLFTTSMFGTGIDISRLNLMIVHGQPKNTSSYIQATGRVDRKRGGLVITLLRSTRPRDLNHYEFFIGYHRALYRHVEPVSVFPFSPKAIYRSLGPVAVALLRNARQIEGTPVNSRWYYESKEGKKSKKSNRIRSGAREMDDNRNSNEIKKIIEVMEKRSQNQPTNRAPNKGEIEKIAGAQFDRWEIFAKTFEDLLYWEQTLSATPVHPAVLGSPQYDDDRAVFRNSPTSLREVESTCGFGDDVF